MIDFYSMISKSELSMLSYIRETSTSDEQYSNFGKGVYCSDKYFLRHWEYEKNTNPLINTMFKNQLILSKRVQVTESEDEITQRVKDIINDDDFYFFYKKSLTALTYYNRELWDENQIHWPGHINYEHPGNILVDCTSNFELFCLRQMLQNFYLTPNYFTKNIYTGPTCVFAISKEKNYTLQTGAKTSKALMKMSSAIISYLKDSGSSERLIDEWKEKIENIRISLSTVRNQANFNTQLCLSIHPLDYLTASENSNDWRSCMNIWDGEYRRGVIEMMNSPYVIVAYTPSEHEEVSLGSYFWNSKKWREFFIVHPTEGVFGIKGYPFWNTSLETTVLNWIKELLVDQNYSDVLEYNLSEDGQYDFKFPTMKCGPAMYNDFYGRNTYRCILASNNHLTQDDRIHIDYSGISECLVCGESGEFDNEASLSCYNCCEYHYCCKCGETISNPEDLVIFNGNEYCTCCYDDLPVCECCNDTYDNDDDFDIAIGISSEPGEFIPTNILDRDEHKIIRSFFVCPSCREKYIKDAMTTISQAPMYSHWWRNIPIIRPSQFINHDKYSEFINCFDEDILELGEHLYQMDVMQTAENEIETSIKAS